MIEFTITITITAVAAGVWSLAITTIDRAYCAGSPFEPAAGPLSGVLIAAATSITFGAAAWSMHSILLGG